MQPQGGFVCLCVLAALSAVAQAPAEQVDSIVILKKDHRMDLFARGKVIRTYKVALGRAADALELTAETRLTEALFGS